MDIKKILFKTSSIDVEKALPDALLLVSKDGKIEWVNDVAAELFETSKMHLLTSNINDFVENAISITKNAISQNKPVIIKSPNKEIYYDMTAREVEQGYVLDIRDVKDIQTQETPEDNTSVINRDKNNFLLKLTNDLKAPIQSIVGFSQAMSDGLGGKMSEQQEKYIRIINKNSTDLMYFIAKLLELSQTESGLYTPDKKTFDSLALINSVVRFNEQLYKDKDINLNVKPDESYKKNIITDADILKNIMQDLLEVILKSVDMGDINIILSTPDEEYIQSKNLPQGNYAFISVTSSALLLSENDLDCMFDPYKIVDSSNRKNVLRAMVLASVKNLVKTLGGYIWVESQILKSTSFNILLPV